MIRNLLITTTIAIAVSVGRAEEIVTDRPDATESSSTVAPGYFQLETGFTYFEENDDESLKGYSVPESLLRIGLVEDWELRLGWGGYVSTDDDDDGANDAEIGFKVRLLEESGWIPETAFLSHLSIPAGQDPYSSERFDPSYRFAFSHTLSERLSLGYNLGQAWATEKDEQRNKDTLSVFQYTVALGIGLTDTLGTFVEFFGDIPTGASGGPANTFNGGLTYLLAENLQLDLAGGIGLSEDAEDWFVGVGVSFRLPN